MRSVRNPVARRIGRRYTLADLRSAHNHYLLNVANVFDRTLRAKGAQAQKHLKQYLRHKDKHWEIWRAGHPCRQLDGPSWNFPRKEDFWFWIQQGRARPSNIGPAKVRWRLLTQSTPDRCQNSVLGNGSQAGNSAYCAQASEIGPEPLAAHLIFQFGGLRFWRDVALKVPKTVGRKSICVYEVTSYPERGSAPAIKWDIVHFPPAQDPAEVQGRKRLDIYIMDWVQADVAVTATIASVEGL